MSNHATGHGGSREGAGRKPGRPSLRRAAQAIVEVEEAFPGWSPVLHLAAVANDETLPAEVRLDAAKAAAPFLHSRPKPVEMEPDALVDLERRLMAAKIEETAKAIRTDEGLAERLARAKRRKLAAEVMDVFDALSEAADDALPVGMTISEEVAAAKRPQEPQPRRLTPTKEPAGLAPPAPAPASAPPAPILPRPEPRSFGDWSAPFNSDPERQAFMDEGRDYADDPFGLLANRD